MREQEELEELEIKREELRRLFANLPGATRECAEWLSQDSPFATKSRIRALALLLNREGYGARRRCARWIASQQSDGNLKRIYADLLKLFSSDPERRLGRNKLEPLIEWVERYLEENKSE